MGMEDIYEGNEHDKMLEAADEAFADSMGIEPRRKKKDAEDNSILDAADDARDNLGLEPRRKKKEENEE